MPLLSGFRPGKAWDQVKRHGGLDGFVGGEDRAVVGKPLHGMRRADGTEALLLPETKCKPIQTRVRVRRGAPNGGTMSIWGKSDGKAVLVEASRDNGSGSATLPSKGNGATL